MVLGASQQCIIFGCYIFLNNYSELPYHLNFSKLILQMYFGLSFPLFFWPKSFFHVFGFFFFLTNRPPKEGVLDKKILGCKKVFQGSFWKIWHIQIQIHPQTYIEPKYGAFYLKSEVSAHGLVLLVQLSWRVAPPWEKVFCDLPTFRHSILRLTNTLLKIFRLL